MTELESGFRVADVVGIVRRRSAIILGSAVVGLVLGYLVFASAPPKYSATSRVQVKTLIQNPLDPGPKDTQKLDVGTEQDLVKSDAVGDAVRKQLDLEGDNRALFRLLTVTAKEDSLVLELTVESGSAKKAQSVSNAIAEAYLAERERQATERRDKAIARIDQQRQDANAALTEANAAYAATEPGTPDARCP